MAGAILDTEAGAGAEAMDTGDAAMAAGAEDGTAKLYWRLILSLQFSYRTINRNNHNRQAMIGKQPSANI